MCYCLSALGIRVTLSRAWHPRHPFLRLVPAPPFPALGIHVTLSRAWHPRHPFPLLASASLFRSVFMSLQVSIFISTSNSKRTSIDINVLIFSFHRFIKTLRLGRLAPRPPLKTSTRKRPRENWTLN